jgi:hypothetical protein
MCLCFQVFIETVKPYNSENTVNVNQRNSNTTDTITTHDSYGTAVSDDDIYYTGRYNSFGCASIMLKYIVWSTLGLAVLLFIASFVFIQASFYLFFLAYISLLLFCMSVVIYAWTYRQLITQLFLR